MEKPIYRFCYGFFKLQILKICLIKEYACVGKTWAKILFSYQNQIVMILKKQVVRNIVWFVEKNTKSLAIFNKYKDNFNDFIDSLDEEFLEPIDKKSYKILKFKSSLKSLLEEKDVSN